MCIRDSLHAGHIGEAVADVDHVGEGYPLAVVGHGGVEGMVVGHVQHPLVDAVDELGLGDVYKRQPAEPGGGGDLRRNAGPLRHPGPFGKLHRQRRGADHKLSLIHI